MAKRILNLLYGSCSGNAHSCLDIAASPFDDMDLKCIANNMPYKLLGIGGIYEPEIYTDGSLGVGNHCSMWYGIEFEDTQYILADCIFSDATTTSICRIRFLTMIIIDNRTYLGSNCCDWYDSEILWEVGSGGYGKKLLVNNLYGDGSMARLYEAISVKRAKHNIEVQHG